MTKRKAKSSRNRKFNPLFLLLLLATAFILIFSTVQIPVTAQQISFSPPNGPDGTLVIVTGTGFSSTDVTCQISSTTSGLIAPGWGCAVAGGIVNGNFVIGPGIGPGTYTISVYAYKVGPVLVDTVSQTFTVLQPTITLTPQSGPPNTVVNVNSGGVLFSVGETGCTITSTPIMAWVPPACAVSSGVVTGQFKVPLGTAAGPYLIDVTGTSSGAVASAVFTVTSGTTVISVTPTDGPIHTLINVQGSGFSSIDTGCQITASLANLVAATPAPTCSMSSGTMTGTFYVGVAVPANSLQAITVTGTPGGDAASVSFTVDGSPVLTFTPPSPKPTGTTVVVGIVFGGQFSSGDTITTPTCTITSNPSGLFSSSACSIGSGGTSLTGTFFVVANVASGSTYTVTVQGTLLDFASASFTVAPPAPSIFLSPSDGPVGTSVTVSGTGFPGQDSTCVLSSAAPLFAASPAPTCSISSGLVTGSFKVASGAAPSPILVTVTSSSGPPATASETFTVNPTPILSLTPTSAPPGATVTVTLLGVVPAFSTGDSSSCTISSSPGGLFSSSACFLSQGPLQSLAGTFFVVANVPTGSSYIVTVTGSLGDSGSTALVFTVAPPPTGPQVILSPSDGPRGTTITLTGTAFAGVDTSCVITSTPTNIIASPSCSVSNTGVVTGSFQVATGAASGAYNILVTGSSGDSNVLSPATFGVDETPILAFSIVPPGTPGQTVSVTILNFPPGQFSSGDTSCSISSLPSGLFASSNCHIGAAGTDLTGTFFTIASVPTGSFYTVVVTGNLGDTGTGFYFVAFTPLLTLTPSYGSPGDKISFVATGLLVSDTSCSITSNPGTNGASLIDSPSCSISAGTGTGTFIVGSKATADGSILSVSSPYTVTVTGNSGGDSVPTGFQVVPEITLTPTNGVVSTPVSFTGSGFGSGALGCFFPTGSVASVPVVAFTTVGCNIVVPGPNGNGQVSGTFTMPVGTLAGTYVITVTDAPGAFAASAAFTLGTPSAQVTISPNVALPGTSVGVSGFGFNGDDTGACVITGFPALSTFTCNISGGTAGGAIKLDLASPAGMYLITVTGSKGDFASNYLEIILYTGTLTSITTTSSTSIVSTTFTTFTTSTSLSLSSTTFTFTGISTAVSNTLTTQTFTGQSTAAIITTTTSTTSTVQATATTIATTVSTIGQAIRPVLASNQISYDAVSFIAVLTLLGSMVLRRLFF